MVFDKSHHRRAIDSLLSLLTPLKAAQLLFCRPKLPVPNVIPRPAAPDADIIFVKLADLDAGGFDFRDRVIHFSHRMRFL